MTNIKQTIFCGAIKKIIMVSLVLIGPLAISPTQAAKPGSGGGGSAFCPCFTSTVIDANIAQLGGSGVGGLLNGTDGGFTCEDNGDAVNLSFNNADHSVSVSVFGELTKGNQGPGCGWSGRPLDSTTQEASECQNEIKQSWAWQVLGCPSL